MTDNDASIGRIDPPKEYRRNEIARAVAKAAVGGVPIVGPVLTEAADVLLPDHGERDRRRWEGEVSREVNGLTDRVAELGRVNEVILQGSAAEIASFLIKRCPDGMAIDDVEIDDMQASLPDLSEDEILDGLAELQSYGLVQCYNDLNSEGPYTLTEDSYAALDQSIMGWDTIADAQQIAAALVAETSVDGVATAELEAKFDWDRRRFNPALREMTRHVDPSCLDNTMQPYWVTAGIYLSRPDRMRLKRFAEQT